MDLEKKRKRLGSHKTRTPQEIATAELRRKEKERLRNAAARQRRRAAMEAANTSDTHLDRNEM